MSQTLSHLSRTLNLNVVGTLNRLSQALNLGVVGPYRLVADPQPKCRLLYKLILRYTLSKLLVLLYTSDAAGIQRR
jgi:hypothetical protein